MMDTETHRSSLIRSSIPSRTKVEYQMARSRLDKGITKARSFCENHHLPKMADILGINNNHYNSSHDIYLVVTTTRELFSRNIKCSKVLWMKFSGK